MNLIVKCYPKNAYKNKIYILGVTPNSQRFDASIGGAWFNSLHGGAQMSDFTENYTVFSQ